MKNSRLFRKITKIICGLIVTFFLICSCRTIPFSSTAKEDNFGDYLFKKYHSSDSKFYSCDQIDLTLINTERKSAKAKVFIHRGESIYANISFFGFELGRVEITTDSIKIINRIEKTYLFDNLDKLNLVLNTGLSYNQIESLILNGFITEKGENRRKLFSHISDTTDSFIVSYQNSQGIFIKSFFNKISFKETKIEIHNDKAGFALLALIESYNDLGSYPESIKVNLKKGDYNIELDVRVGNISYNKFENRTFDVNSKYREISF